MGKASRGKWERRLAWTAANANRDFPDTLGRRLVNFVEQPLFTLPVGIVGGIVGLIYTPSLLITAACIVLAFHRAGVVKGYSLWKQGITYLLVTVISFAGAWKLASFVRASTHLPTATEIASAVWNAHKDSPSPPQVTNVYQTTVAPSPKGPLIDLGQPYPSQTQGELYFTVEKTNIGDQIAKRVLNTTGVYVLPVSRKSEEQVFRDLYNKDAIVTDDDAVGDEGIGIEHRSHVNFPAHFSPEDVIKLQDKKNGAYVVMLVTYSDSRGIRHSSEVCWIYSPLFPTLGTCSKHNGAR